MDTSMLMWTYGLRRESLCIALIQNKPYTQSRLLCSIYFGINMVSFITNNKDLSRWPYRYFFVFPMLKLKWKFIDIGHFLIFILARCILFGWACICTLMVPLSLYDGFRGVYIECISTNFYTHIGTQTECSYIVRFVAVSVRCPLSGSTRYMSAASHRRSPHGWEFYRIDVELNNELLILY